MVVGGRYWKRRVQENAAGDTEMGCAGAAFVPQWQGVSLVIPGLLDVVVDPADVRSEPGRTSHPI